MEDQGRQRWVGALLLVLLVVILAPLVLRSPEEVRVALDMSMPPPPDVTRLDIKPVAEPREVEQVQAAIEAERRALDAETEAHQLAVEQAREADKAPPAEPLMSGWGVQVASFSERDNAETLARRLRDADYNAFVRRVEQDDRTLYRVLAGPELQRERADQLRRRLVHDEDFGFQGLVVPLTID